MNSEFIFFRGVDSYGYDVAYYKEKTVDELMKICLDTDSAGFNTLGFIKKIIIHPAMFGKCPMYNGRDGLYVRKDKMQQTPQRIEGYDYVDGMDSLGGDIAYQIPITMKKLAEYSNEHGYVGFNTMGFMKGEIGKLVPNVNPTAGGIYIKRDRFRIKMLCNWCHSKELCDDWNRMSQGDYRWNDIEITDDDKNIDFYVIVNRPNWGEKYVSERTIVLHMEPWCYDPRQNWGVKTWGPWSKPEKSKFLQVRSHDNYLNTTFWQLKTTYNEFMNIGIISKSKIISTICSSKYFDPGHIKRIDFLKYIENKNDPNVCIHLYNHDNEHKFRNYQGPHPPENKDIAILPYKYYFMMENNAEKNFITEKIWEPLICECVCFYWGCPNITDWINPETFILLDINNFEKSYQIIKNSIANDEWSKRIDAIRIEKQKILNHYNFFPTLERIIKNEFKFKYAPSDDEIIYHKYFHSLLDLSINRACFIHGFSQDMIDYVFERNCFNKIIVINIGTHQNYVNDNVLVINYSENTTLTMKESMKLVHVFSKFNECQILFLHTEMIGHQSKDVLLNKLVDQSELCIELLQNYDTVGCNFKQSPKPHFSFNFWWATSTYLKELTLDESHEWLLLSNPNATYFSFDDIDYKIKCVNLLRRSDRKESVTKELVSASLLEKTNFIEAVDGQQLIANDFIKKLFNGNDFASRRGVIGCALSHYYLWKQLLDDRGIYLIIEDDIEIAENFNTNMAMLSNELMKCDWDIVYLGYHERKSVKYDGPIKVIPYDTQNNIGGTFGYLVKKTGAAKFLSFIETHGIRHGIDYLMFHYAPQMNLKQFQVMPQLIISEYVSSDGIVDSDIQYDVNRLF